MCKDTFNAILDRLLDALNRENTRFRDAIAPDLRLGIGLYQLFHGVAVRPLALMFGVGTSTAHESRDIVVDAVVSELYGASVALPRSGNGLQNIIDGFQRLGMPNCFGALDGTHFRIVDRGIKFYHDYFCYKHFLSVLAVVSGDRPPTTLGPPTVLGPDMPLSDAPAQFLSPSDEEPAVPDAAASSPQMVCDAELKFLYGVYGWPGKANDARAWRASALSTMLANGTLFTSPADHMLWAGTVRDALASRSR